VLDVRAVTADQPFCAGAVILYDGRLVVTLNDDHLPGDAVPGTLRVGGVGGGQEPGETIWDCAVREAFEEACVHVDLESAPVTMTRDDQEPELRRIDCVDEIAPLLFERETRANPDVPFAPGLPSGPYVYVASFLARPERTARLEPGDVRGLLLVAPNAVASLDGSTLGEAVDAGAELVERERLDPGARLWLHPNETLRVLPDALRGAGIAGW
jgi:8-oxo-dGTP pyrophosphatase MutT (NUDIX family)